MRPQSAPPVKQDGQPVTRSPNFPQHFRLPGQDRSAWICGRSVIAHIDQSFKRDENWPICPWCKSFARPHVLMFNDAHMASDMEQELRFQRWREVLIDAGRQYRLSRGKLLRVVILEIGCGGRVPTVRATSETTAAQLKKNAEVTVARINRDFPLPDRLHPLANDTRYLCLPMKGLEALRKISEHYTELMKPKPASAKATAKERLNRSRSRDAEISAAPALASTVDVQKPQESKESQSGPRSHRRGGRSQRACQIRLWLKVPETAHRLGQWRLDNDVP
eukprot:symbB.v1.2.023992.t1/scaffold2228.1/size107706/4